MSETEKPVEDENPEKKSFGESVADIFAELTGRKELPIEERQNVQGLAENWLINRRLAELRRGRGKKKGGKK